MQLINLLKHQGMQNLFRAYINLYFSIIKMKKQQFNTQLKQGTFLIKQKSLSSLQSRTFSVSQIIKEKQSELSNFKKLQLLKKNQLLNKSRQINQLQHKLKGALNFAITQKLANSKKKQEIYFDQKLRKWFEYKVKELENIIVKQKQKNVQFQSQLQDTKKLMEMAYEQKNKLNAQLQEKEKEILKQKKNYQKMKKFEQQLQNIEPLKQRIKFLQITLREEKMKFTFNKKQFEKIYKENQKLKNQISKQKPYQQQLKQEIAYLERVNLDLSRKMQDFNRRQNQYIKNANSQRNLLIKTTNQRNTFQTNLQSTQKKLQKQYKNVNNLQSQVRNKNSQIIFLKDNLHRQCTSTINLTKQLQATIQFYKTQADQNVDLKKRNKILQEHQVELRKIISHFQLVNAQVNITIMSRTQQIQKLIGLLDSSRKQLNTLQQKFCKFQTIFQQKSQRGQTQIRQFFYKHIRQNNKLQLTVKQLRAQLQQRILTFGQQRDTLVKQYEIRNIPPPDDNNLYLVVYEQKKQQLIVLQGSNDQLLKIKKDLQLRLLDADKKLQEQKKQTLSLKLKAADVFRAKKQVQDARKSVQRYQQMIQQQKLSIVDLQSQLKILREKLISGNDKSFQLQLQNKNNQIQLRKMNQIIEQLNAKKLNVVKKINEKKGHLISDSIQKLQNGIRSLSFFFTCCFCHQSNSMLVTLANCGHNFCQKPKCKQAYTEYCYQCDTGMPIQRIFPNKFLKQAVGKYKFLQMVIQETLANIKAINQQKHQVQQEGKNNQKI